MTIDSRIATICARGIAIRGDEVDTDRIIPARFLRCVVFDGLGEQAFRDERFAPDGSMRPHAMNDPRFDGAGVLVVNRNFGCGSSREHAPQALARRGIQAIVGESFADIFSGNCAAIGLPVVSAAPADIAALQDLVETKPGTEVLLDLEAMTVVAGDLSIPASMPEAQRRKFLAGTWDSLATLLARIDRVETLAAGLPYIRGFAT